MHGRRGVLISIGVLALLTGSSTGAFALVDDFETDFWLPYTDFLLGDKASAGYASTFARSGTRSFHVDISGYSILDFGSAYGYAVFPTQGAAMTELRVSILYDHLHDTTASNWDAYAAGVALDLLDKDFRNLDRVRYVTAYQASRKLSLCGPTKSDVVLAPPSGLGVWTDLARNPAADFPAAHWQSAKFVRVAIGFLCTAGLQGASYSLYFDDFSFDTDGRDADADGLSDLDEESRVYSMSITSGSTPVPIPSSNIATIEIQTPPSTGSSSGPGSGSRSNILGRTACLWHSRFQANPARSCCGTLGSTRAGPRFWSRRPAPRSEGPSRSVEGPGMPIHLWTSTSTASGSRPCGVSRTAVT